MKITSRSSGFTIVELLIVIVVISILAAVTIVAFNGIQNLAKESSLKSDVTNSLKAVELAQTASNNVALTNLPSQVKASTGNVLSLFYNSFDSSYCVTGYQSSPLRAVSNSTTLGLKDGLCPGVTVGSPTGGAVPPLTGLLLMDSFSDWSLYDGNGVQRGSSPEELKLTLNATGSFVSPLIPVRGSSQVTITISSYATVASPADAPLSSVHTSVNYLAADGVTPALNSSNATSNGNARETPLNQWANYTNSFVTGANVYYVKLYVEASEYTSDNTLKDLRITYN